MKRVSIFLFLGITLLLEGILFVYFVCSSYEVKNDTVLLNEVSKQIEEYYGDTSKYPTALDYVVIDSDGNVIYKTKDGLSESINQAYQNCDTIMDLRVEGATVGKIIVKNQLMEKVEHSKAVLLRAVLCISVLQIVGFLLYYLYLYKTILKPFKDMREFAERVAGGNLDIPLTMDKGNSFGAFTESFDIMRSELKKAKLKEAEAEKSKRELVARLSHDIKTPVASIKSLSELGEAISNEEKSKEKFEMITEKSDQINALVQNLFTITIEELEELSINPAPIPSYVVGELIRNADYKNRSKLSIIPECMVFFDRLRLQQVLDNIFANSYKYANTNMELQCSISKEYLVLSIKDFGDSILDKDMPLLLEKYKRGSNTIDKEGAGLGLYISSRFMEGMNGKIEIYNDKPGFKVLLYLRII